MSELIERGAEASIYRKNKKIIKHREPKKYRIKELDKKIREQRTKKEAKVTQDARKNGVPTPIILDINKDKIWFEYIEGEKIKERYNELNKKTFREIGNNIAKLHNAGIIHGDLTTSNILQKNKKIFLIDFGLSGYDEHIEPKGVDLHVLFETIKSTHPASINSIKEIKKAYKSKAAEAKKTLKRVKEIQKRGRYF